MKAYYGVEDHKLRLFRPKLNMERMKNSAKAASLPVSCFSMYELWVYDH